MKARRDPDLGPGPDQVSASEAQEFDEVDMAEEPDGGKAVANAAVRRLTDRTMRGEGRSYDDDDTPDANTAGAAGRASFKVMALSQLDDWLHRGDDPIVVHVQHVGLPCGEVRSPLGSSRRFQRTAVWSAP